MDSDLPYNLYYLNIALALIKNADAVIGVKFGERESFRRWLFSFAYNFLIRVFFRLKFHDINFSFKLMRRDALKKLDLRSNGWFIDAEVLIELKKQGMKVIETPIKYDLRNVDNSKVVIGHKIVINLLKEIVNYVFRH